MIYRNQNLRHATDLDDDSLKKTLPQSKAAAVLLTNMLTQNSFRRTGAQLSACTVSDPSSCCPTKFVEEHEVVEDINGEISATGLQTAPSRMPGVLKPKRAVPLTLQENSGKSKGCTAYRYVKRWLQQIALQRVNQVLAMNSHSSTVTSGGRTSEKPEMPATYACVCQLLTRSTFNP